MLLRILYLILIFVVFLADGAAIAEEDPAGPVKGRPRPSYDALGIRLGSFMLKPTLDIEEVYDNNVFGKNADTSDDFITTLSPKANIKSDFGRHSVEATVGAKIGRYAEFSTEDYEDYSASARGKLDLTQGLSANLGVGVKTAHEARGHPDEPGGVEPGKSMTGDANLGVSYKVSKIGLDFTTAIEISDHDDVKQTDGTTINNDDRDRYKFSTSIKVGYEISPEYTGFAKLENTLVDYNDDVDDNGDNRDSTNYTISFGVDFLITSLIEGSVSAGYFRQSYDDPQYRDVSGPSLGLDLTWNVTKLTTITGGIKKEIKETTSTDVSGITSTQLKFGVDHELLRNVILSVAGNYAYDVSNGSEKIDTTMDMTFGAKYLMNRKMFLEFELKRSQRDSNTPGNDQAKTLGILRLGTQL